MVDLIPLSGKPESGKFWGSAETTRSLLPRLLGSGPRDMGQAKRGHEAEYFQHRFWSKVDKNGPNGCWIWTAGKTSTGYGEFEVGYKMRKAHRVAYELVKGEIPGGLPLDHLCKNIVCVNPDHLEPVTTRENLLRGDTITRRNVDKTHCIHGHPLSGDNLVPFMLARGERRCATCVRERKRQEYWRRKNVPTA